MLLNNSSERKKQQSKQLLNKKMNSLVFQERTKVIECIYELKKQVPSLPRIEVKVTHDGEGSNKYILGQGRLNNNQIWITERCLNSSTLYQVVAHEIIHAVLGLNHDESCKLMKSTLTEILPKDEVNKIFKNYFYKRGS